MAKKTVKTSKKPAPHFDSAQRPARPSDQDQTDKNGSLSGVEGIRKPPRYRGYLGLDWYKKDRAILLLGDDDMKKETDEKIPAPRLHWVNEDGALFYEIDEAEGKGKRPYWVDRNDIRVKEPRPLIFQKGFVAEEKTKSGTMFEKSYRVKETNAPFGSAPKTETRNGSQGAIDRSVSGVEPTNMLIRGDNLLALNTLVKMFENRPDEEKVKCIYIDPPYNTGSAFEHYDDNLEHSQWLTMMRDRLYLLRKILSSTGCMFVQLDDQEIFQCKLVLDEVFGRDHFVSMIVWQKVFAKKNKALISSSHDGILLYAANTEFWKRNLLPRSDDQEAAFKNPDNDVRGKWQSVSYSVQSEDSEKRKAYRYRIKLPNGEFAEPPPGRHWNGLPERTIELIKDNRLWFGSDGSKPPRLKVFLSEVQDGIVPDSWWAHENTGNNQEGKKEVLELFPNIEPFGTPKPERLIERIIHIATNPGDLVLDCFAGSGTTLAVAQKMGRRYIGVEIGKHADTHIIPRMKKVLSGEDQGGISRAVNWQGGGSFQYFHLGDSILAANGKDFNWKLDPAHIAESLLYYFDFVHNPTVKLDGMFAGYNAETDTAGIVCVKNPAKDRSMMVGELEILTAVNTVRKVHGACPVKFITNCAHQIPGNLSDVDSVSVPSSIVTDLE